MEQEIRIAAKGTSLDGDLHVPNNARGIVLFAHGSGSSRHSPRNRLVAQTFNAAGLATLLFDLLTREEEILDAQTAHLRFDILLLANRLCSAAHEIRQERTTRDLPIGYFGASTGGGAALVAAAEEPAHIGAVVSRGGRPDLAGAALPKVRAPTLLIVGGSDEAVIDLNRAAMAQMRAPVELEIIARATHLFEEAGALDRVAELAKSWFLRHLTR